MQQLTYQQPNGAEERVMMVARLYELIEQTNTALDFHQRFANPDRLAIQEYTKLKQRYVNDLSTLLHLARIEGDLRVQQAA